MRVDREVELPAGAIRVAPIESSVNGVIVVPAARFGTTRVTGIRLEFASGKVVRAHADTNDDALQTFLKSAPGADRSSVSSASASTRSSFRRRASRTSRTTATATPSSA